jgi:hypothetical protein
VGIDGSAVWEVPANNAATIDFNFLTLANFGSLPETAGNATNQTAGSSNNPPTAVCQPVTVPANGSCQAAVIADDVDNGSSDSDGTIVNKSIDPAGPFTVGATVVTLTVTDDDGATATCTATVTVQDIDVPVIVCPDNISVEVPEPETAATVNYTTPGATDNCPNPVVVCDPASGSSFPLGPTVVTCTATDAADLSASCNFTVTVTQVPNVSPVALCQDVTVAANGSCEATVAAAQVDNGSNDPDGSIAGLTLAPAGPYALGETVVTLTVTDNVGATATCTATITVEDQTAPQLSACPANISLTVPNGQLTTPVSFTAPSATDNCSTPTVQCNPASGSDFALGTTTVTCTATDESANSSSCTFTVTVTELIGDCENIRDLIDSIELLELKPKIQDRLLSILSEARAAKRNDQLGLMRRKLREFRSEMRDLAEANKIDPELAEPLRTCARILIELSFLDEERTSAADDQETAPSDDNQKTTADGVTL